MPHKHAAGRSDIDIELEMIQCLRQDTKRLAYTSIRGLLVPLQHSINASVLFKTYNLDGITRQAQM